MLLTIHLHETKNVHYRCIVNRWHFILMFLPPCLVVPPASEGVGVQQYLGCKCTLSKYPYQNLRPVNMRLRPCPFTFDLPSQANLKNVSDQVSSVVTNAEQESILTRLFQKVTLTLHGINRQKRCIAQDYTCGVRLHYRKRSRRVAVTHDKLYPNERVHVSARYDSVVCMLMKRHGNDR